jgi:hypothetical protein
MKLEKFDRELQKINTNIGTFRPFKGDVQNIILAESLFERSSVSMLLEQLTEGHKFKTAHLATKEQLQELGINVSGAEFFISDSPAAFTVPVILPE